jgi:hypothetical protein
MPMPGPGWHAHDPLESLADLAAMLDHLRTHARSIGRTAPIDVMCVLPGPAAAADAGTVSVVDRLAELGVTWLAVNGTGETVDEATAFIDRFAAGVLARR